MSGWGIAVWGSLIMSLMTLVLYWTASGRGASGPEAGVRRSRILMARGAAWGGLALLLASSAALMAAFLNHDFRLAYVASYSSRQLPAFYLISGFWAGQEGTFLLWAMLSAIVSLVLAYTSGEHEAYVMRHFSLVQLGLLALLVKASPFTLLASAPPDGVGLNPLLQDPWMVIHPPIVFVGYALWAAPFAWALAALTEDDYSSWVKHALPWALAAWLFLGAGILIGAKWAYAVLGWGGYWGWDPVENASLVPWLTGMALLHTMLMQRTRGKMIRTNVALSLITFLLIVYGTFLTRSGVLSDFSVHSFSDLGLSSALVWAMAFYTAVAFSLFVYRLPSMTRKRGYSEPFDHVASRDFAFVLTATLLLASAGVTLLGTSAPLITGVTGNPSAVSTSFYNITNAPLGALIALVMGICPLLAWRGSSTSELKKAMTWPGIAALMLTLAAVFLGVRQPWFLLFLFASFLALAANLMALVRAAKGGIAKLGGYATHVGAALILVGIIATSAYGEAVHLTLKPGASASAFGWEFNYSGAETSPGADPAHPRREYSITATKAGMEFEARPSIQQSDSGVIRRPSIHSTLVQDIYISPTGEEEPSALRPTGRAQEFTITKGQSVTYSGLAVRFMQFDMTAHGEAKMAVGAVLEISSPGGDAIATATPVLGFTESGKDFHDAVIATPIGPVAFRLSGIDASAGAATIQIILMGDKAAEPDVQSNPASDSNGNSSGAISVEVSRKPFASLLWIGSILLLAGTAVAVIRRTMESASTGK
ncbi:MAG: cytochrome c biogenesis protein CcsA [Clostridia bacterium]|nr:cytochrome c biogenesis protein CcsA [Clostridia bacterium]